MSLAKHPNAIMRAFSSLGSSNPVSSKLKQNPKIAYMRIDIFEFINDGCLSPLSRDEDTMEMVGRVKLIAWKLESAA